MPRWSVWQPGKQECKGGKKLCICWMTPGEKICCWIFWLISSGIKKRPNSFLHSTRILGKIIPRNTERDEKGFLHYERAQKELGRTLDDLDIEDVNLQCKRKSELYFLEERLALIEERLSPKVDCKAKGSLLLSCKLSYHPLLYLKE